VVEHYLRGGFTARRAGLAAIGHLPFLLPLDACARLIVTAYSAYSALASSGGSPGA